MKKYFEPSLAAVSALIIAAVVYIHPFPGACINCNIMQRFSGILFGLLGLTAFWLPLFLMLILFRHREKVKAVIKYSLILWLPVLLNLALIRDMLEFKANLGGIAGNMFAALHNHNVDFIFIFIPIVIIDLFILYLLGVDIPGAGKRLLRRVRNYFNHQEE